MLFCLIIIAFAPIIVAALQASEAENGSPRNLLILIIIFSLDKTVKLLVYFFFYMDMKHPLRFLPNIAIMCSLFVAIIRQQFSQKEG